MDRFLSYYKGRITVSEAEGIPLRDFQGYFYIAYRKDLTKRINEKKNPPGEGAIDITAIQEELEDIVP